VVVVETFDVDTTPEVPTTPEVATTREGGNSRTKITIFVNKRFNQLKEC
jgi:hypothetical protein